ncbi:MAG: restriction endonuclease subunit S, partial [Nitrososphaerota archaeon]
FPILEDQKRIVEVLSAVDLAIQMVDEAIVRAERLKKGLMQQLLTKGIGHKEFKETPIGKIPKTWKIVKLGDLTENITKGTTPTTFGFNFTQHGIRFIKVESIDEHGNFIQENIPYISEEADEKLSRSRLKENDILFSIAGALGRVAIVTKEILPANVNQALAIIRLKSNDQIVGKYLGYYLKGPFIQSYVTKIAVQSAQANLTLAQVKNFLIVIPPKDEQQQIAEVLSSMDNILRLKKKKKEQLVKMKKCLMDLLLTGKVRVSL